MKPLGSARPRIVLAASIAAILIASKTSPSLIAATLTWDIAPGVIGPGDNAITGGAGTWNQSGVANPNGNWTADGGATNVAWVNANNDTAIFSGTGGLVTLSGGIQAGGITFDSAGYAIATSTLTLAGTTPTIATNADGTIQSVIAGNAGITKMGSGKLTLTAINTVTGGVNVNEGILEVNRTVAGQGIAANVPINIAPGATVQLTGNQFNILGDGASLIGLITIGNGGTLTANGSVNNAHNVRGLSLSGGTVASANGNDGGFGNFVVSGTVTQTGDITSNITATRIALKGNISFDVADGAAVADLNVSSGLVDGGGANALTKIGAGTLVMSGASTYTGGTTISAGTLQLGDGGFTGTLGAATGSVVNDATLAFNFGGTVTVPNTIVGSGVLRQDGVGAVILTGNNDQAGGTQINAGKLFINGSLNGPVTVAGGALGGSGTVNGVVTVNDGGAIESSNGVGASTLTLSSLTLGTAAGNLSTFNLFPISGLPSVQISDADGLRANGGAQSATINIAGPAPGIGTFTLIDYNGTLGGGFAAFNLGTLAPRVIGDLVDNAANSSIDFNVTGTDFPIWSGALNGTWSTATLADPKNWVLDSDSSPTDFIAGDNVLFNDAATGTTTVDISGADVVPNGLTFSNSTNAYTLTGTNGIVGAVALNKSGAGMLTIGNTNSFTGAANIAEGTVSVVSVADGAVASPLGAGLGVSLGGSTTTGTLQFTGMTGATNRPLTLQSGGGVLAVTDAAGTLTQSGVVSGDGGLTKAGGGTLVLSAINTYAGETTVNEGTLQLNAAGANGVGAIRGTLTVAPGAIVRTTVENALGWNGTAQIFTLNLNGGMLDNTVAGDQSWGIAINLTGGTL